jgi:hypothetical protein
MQLALFRLKLCYQVVGSLVRLGIGYVSFDPSVVSNSPVDLDAPLAHFSSRIRATSLLMSKRRKSGQSSNQATVKFQTETGHLHWEQLTTR